MTSSTLNSQVVDSVAAMNFLSTSSSPANSQAMLDAVMAETLGMAMHNAVMRQQANSLIGSAATTAACARMLQLNQSAPSSGQAPNNPLAPTPTPPSPTITPLTGPDSANGTVAIAKAEAKATQAINDLEGQAHYAQNSVAKAESVLNNLMSMMSGKDNAQTPASGPVSPANSPVKQAPPASPPAPHNP